MNLEIKIRKYFPKYVHRIIPPFTIINGITVNQDLSKYIKTE